MTDTISSMAILFFCGGSVLSFAMGMIGLSLSLFSLFVIFKSVQYN